MTDIPNAASQNTPHKTAGSAGCTLRQMVALPLPAANSEQASLEALLDSLATAFEASPLAHGERRGALLVVTEDAGSATAVQFWRDALAVGPALASPGAFPWCLANAPGAMLARRFAVTGPNLTWLVPLLQTTARVSEAFDGAAAWLADHFGAAQASVPAPEAWVVALRFAAPAARLMVWHGLAATGAQHHGAAASAMENAADLRERMASDWSAANALAR